ncbi:hypothetical protein M407DRAFT_17814 [Tulasnella calospora MUT 4182]|uniref:F-box domain-containing protein n=1 Tax=Tulasnella calospora MUT 4182 TaxID=1051891 RepID=A0A0C3QKX4_9AGAM|nr:hypothetical protein M407DRAFT_17814 [Tulasnella calospora MUT 4182]
MASIPEEIWLLIFKFVQDGVSKASTGGEFGYDLARTASVRPLTETCRTFHRICQPLLFETLVIKHYSERSQNVVDVLRSKPRLRGMVSKVRIRWTRTGDRTLELWDRLEKALMELYCIQDLWIQAANISRALQDHFQRCPRLERLVLINVSMIHGTEPTTISFHSLKYLRYEPHRNIQTTKFFPILNLPRLETLCIDSVFLLEPADLYNHQIFHFNPAVLKELFIEAFLWTESMEVGLVELLKRASRIRLLSFDGLGEFRPGFNLPDDLIPELEGFRGRADNVLTFCKGRPVQNLFTWFAMGAILEMTDDVPNLIQPGSVPLEHLYIDRILWEDDSLGYIARHCPQLVSLKIRAKRIDGTLSTRYHMPKLRKATFLFSEGSWFPDSRKGNLKAESEVKVAEECREFWTQLEYLRLDPYYFWRYRGLEVEQVQGEEVE